MLYEEKIMRSLCEEMGISWVDKKGYPKLNGQSFEKITEDLLFCNDEKVDFINVERIGGESLSYYLCAVLCASAA